MNVRQLAVAIVSVLVSAGVARAAPPTQEDVFRSISSNVDHHESISGTTMAGIGAAVVAVVCVAVVVNARQNRRESAGYAAPLPRAAVGPGNHPAKLVRELMRETGLTKAQMRQLEAANDRLADDDRSVEHLATLLLCPSLLSSANAGRRRE